MHRLRSQLHFALTFCSLSFVFQLTWELAQSPLYTCSIDMNRCFWLCLRATPGDMVMTALLYLFYRRFPSLILTAGAGTVLALIVEKISLVLERWSYFPGMPLIPGIKVGLTPVLQMAILPPLIFYILRNVSAASKSQ